MRIREKQFVDDAEMAEIRSNEALMKRLRVGSRQAKEGGGQLELQVRSSRAVGFVALAIGGCALVLALLWEPLRRPFWLVLFAVAILIGVWRILDRRVRLAISAEGIRYADWGSARVPWEELSGYAWTTWRQNRYLQVIPRRPTELVASFSPFGRIAHLFAGWIRMPRFAIAVTPLEIGEAALDEAISQHLPRAAPLPA